MKSLFITTVFVLRIAGTVSAVCERLQQTVTYTQEEAPRDLSDVLPVVVERVNQVLDGVLNVQVEWSGDDLQGRVGEHTVECKVTREAKAIKEGGITDAASYTDAHGREVVTQCYHVPFTILDTNECTLPPTSPMRHQCHPSTICINTIGSYECLCPRDDASLNPAPGTTVKDESFWDSILAVEDRNEWEVAYNRTSRTTCPSQPSTYGCCKERVHSKDGAACRRSFRCPVNPCAIGSTSSTSPNNNYNNYGHDCAASAECVRSPSPVQHPNFRCQCPAGLIGNGHKCRPGIDPTPEPKVMYDGVTPTEETVKQNYYCDCTKPVIDACSGFPPCKGKHEICIVGPGNLPRCGCEPGYVMHETYGCVDENPPVMKLKYDPHGDQTLRLKQGDIYKEYFVDIQDENAEEYLRSLKISYSRPMPYGCLTEIGEFHVNYTVATPWTAPPYVQLTRRVIIEDIDECKLDVKKYKETCPSLVPKCDFDAGAICVNTIGSYTCRCPKNTEGDGFLPGLKTSPSGYEGGTGCRDVSIPVIHLNGPNPKIFSVCKCGGIRGILGRADSADENDSKLHAGQQKHYGVDIKEMIQKTAGAELCATPQHKKPSPSDCVRAYDETYKGRVDLSKSVKIGEPVQKSPLYWSVPYDVSDAAGNKAATVWRDIIVEEVELEDLEAKMRRDFEKEKETAIRQAVDKALTDERNPKNTRNRRSTPQTCPGCPPCNCAETRGGLDEAACMAMCEARLESCAVDDHNWIIRIFLWLERFFPSVLAQGLIIVAGLVFFLLILRFVLSFFVEQSPYRPPYDTNPEHLQGHVTVYHQMNGSKNTISHHPQPFSDGTYGNGTTGYGGNVGGYTPTNGGFGSGSRNSTTGQFRGAPNAVPPMNSTSLGGPVSNDRGVFSPLSNERLVNGYAPSTNLTDIYQESPLITPNRRGEGVRRRSPFSR